MTCDNEPRQSKRTRKKLVGDVDSTKRTTMDQEGRNDGWMMNWREGFDVDGFDDDSEDSS